MESTTGILIDQVHKFQNSYFKEHLWKAVTVLSKTYCLKYAHDTIFQKALALKLIETLNASSFVSSFLNFVLLVVLQFLSATLAYRQGTKWKKLLIDWNDFLQKSKIKTWILSSKETSTLVV